MSVMVARLKLSNAMCCVVAGPSAATVIVPGLAFAVPIKSPIVLWGDALLTTKTRGDATKLQIGAKLLTGSKFTFRRSGLITTELEATTIVFPSGTARAVTS